jgi:hypothetical protein
VQRAAGEGIQVEPKTRGFPDVRKPATDGVAWRIGIEVDAERPKVRVQMGARNVDTRRVGVFLTPSVTQNTKKPEGEASRKREVESSDRIATGEPRAAGLKDVRQNTQ